MAKTYPIEEMKLGDTVKDIITGFEGVAIAVTKWLMSCDRVVVQPKAGKDGKLPENAAFDIGQLVVIKKASEEVLIASGQMKPKTSEPKGKTGGPAPTPSQHPAPGR